jgi:predicted ATPase
VYELGVRPTEVRDRVKKAIEAAWSLAEEEALDPNNSDPSDQDLEVKKVRDDLRPLLRHLGLQDELRELDEAWGEDGAAGLQRNYADKLPAAWHYCAILDVLPSILTAVDLKLGDASTDAPLPSVPETSPVPAGAIGPPDPGQRLILTARNFYGLRDLRFAPSGVSLLVGPNGAGKTTTLLLLKLLRAALDRGLPEAITLVLNGAQGLEHRDAADDELVEIGVQLDELRWVLRLRASGATVDSATEFLHEGDREIFRRDALGNFTHGERKLHADNRLGLRAILDSQVRDPAVERMVACLRGFTVFHDPDLYALRAGSNVAHTAHLASRGTNAITMLRAWQNRRPDKRRHQLVLNGLREAFPGLIEDFDFIEAGNTLAARMYRPGHEQPEPLRNEANGVLAMLVLLCDLAAADDGGLVAIDEPETALHPYAIQTFVRYAEAEARKRGLRIVLSTHSPVLLDAFAGTPERVYVLDGHTWPAPIPLHQLKNPEWLRQFRLGELYTDGHFGSNDDHGRT